MLRILIADPDPATRKALILLLRLKLGTADIAHVGEVEMLIRALADDPPDLLLLDWRLYGSPAAETCRLLRKAYPHMKIVLLSVDADDAVAAREAGAGFIYKGASPDELIATLASLLRKSNKSSFLFEPPFVDISDMQRRFGGGIGKESSMQTNRSNAGTLIAGTILILFGLMALVSRFLWTLDWGFAWPVIIIGFGSLFLLAMLAAGRQAAALAVPGSIISGIGLILLFQNVTGHWESMSYFWTLIILSVGIGIYIMGWYGEDAHQRRAGWRVMKVGFILFIVFGAFFEGLFHSFNNLVFPVLLIVLGVYLVFSRSGLFGARKVEEPSNNSLPPAS